jgi:hypothetical protein
LILAGTADSDVPAPVGNDIKAVPKNHRQVRIDIRLQQRRLPLDRLPERLPQIGSQRIQ